MQKPYNMHKYSMGVNTRCPDVSSLKHFDLGQNYSTPSEKTALIPA